LLVKYLEYCCGHVVIGTVNHALAVKAIAKGECTAMDMRETGQVFQCASPKGEGTESGLRNLPITS